MDVLVNKLQKIFTQVLYFIILGGFYSICAEAAENRGERSKTLIAEAHSEPCGMQFCYTLIKKCESRGQKVNFFIERDEERMQQARKESELLAYESEKDFLENFNRNHLPIVERKLGLTESGAIYQNIFSSGHSLRDGL